MEVVPKADLSEGGFDRPGEDTRFVEAYMDQSIRIHLAGLNPVDRRHPALGALEIAWDYVVGRGTRDMRVTLGGKPLVASRLELVFEVDNTCRVRLWYRPQSGEADGAKT